MNTPQYPEDERGENDQPSDIPRDGREPLAGNPYANQNRRAVEPDLDANAPLLRDTELRRMNRRALLLLGAVVVLLLFVAYWLFTGAGRHKDAPKPREEKVTVAAAPSLRMPQLPQQAVPAAAPAQAIPVQPQLPPLPRPSAVQTPVPKGPTLLQQRIAASNGESEGGGHANPQASATGLDSHLPNGEEAGPTSAQLLPHPNTLMQRGTYIRCVLETRIISDIPGFTTCLVTEPVYSFNGHTLLLPKGSKMLGSYNSKPVFNRQEVIWDRIITPTGIEVNMKSPGIDNLGSSGVPGHYDAHWAQRISSALLISVLSDAFKYEAAEHGPKTTTIASGGVAVQEPFQSNTAETVQNLANQAVQQSANRAPTVTINQGTIIYIYVAKDVDFSGVVARFGQNTAAQN